MTTTQPRHNHWWRDLADETYWLEITDRPDLGADLNAPQTDESGRPQWTYTLITECRDGDTVFHYHKPASAIVACSRIAGEHWEDDVVWGSHAPAAREQGVEPYTRPGLRIGLNAHTRIEPPVTLEELRALKPQIRVARDMLTASLTGSAYFPFELSDKRPLRPAQAYLTKFPAALLEVIPRLAPAARALGRAPADPAAEQPPQPSGTYRRANEHTAVSQADPFTFDPGLRERALRGHATTQNALADVLYARGITPRSPQDGDPNYDIAWEHDGTLYVGEVKSITDKSEERQLRYGLGQVARYRDSLGRRHSSVLAVLILEREPSDPAWLDICAKADVIATWPGAFEQHLQLP